VRGAWEASLEGRLATRFGELDWRGLTPARCCYPRPRVPEPPGAGMVEGAMNSTAVRLEPISEDNVRAVFDLKVAAGQEDFVASNAWSLAQAVAEAASAWPRAIVAGDEVVGFLMLEIDPEEEDGRPFWLWRLMVGEAYQKRGFGSAALELAMDEVRRRGGTEVYTSWVEHPDGPGPFYLARGFEPTGELDDEEVVARRRL